MPALKPGQSVEFLRTDQSAVPEQTKITCLADAGVYESISATFAAFASVGQGDYFVIVNKAGSSFAVWLDKDANGTAPTGAAYVAAGTKIKASIVTGNTAAQVAAAVVTAVGSSLTNISVSNSGGGVLVFTQTKLGPVTDAASHNTGDTGAGSISIVKLAEGVASNRQNKKFAMQQGDGSTARYVWLNVGGEGVDPTGTGTALEVAVSGGATATQMASALATAIAADSAFYAESSGADCYVWASTAGNATDASDVNTGFTFLVTAQGYDAEVNIPGGNIAAQNPEPSLLVAAS